LVNKKRPLRAIDLSGDIAPASKPTPFANPAHIANFPQIIFRIKIIGIKMAESVGSRFLFGS
jgi:hypothetical protein